MCYEHAFCFSYSLPASQEFTIESSTGVLRTNVLFTERAGNVISFDVTATDKAENRSRSTSVNTYVSVLNNDYILRIIVEDTVEVTQLCRNELMSKLVEITSYQVFIIVIIHCIMEEIHIELQKPFILHYFLLSFVCFLPVKK